MNGLHDMGGQQGYGAVVPEPETPVFHAPWEARALALTLAIGAHGGWNIDQSRYSREIVPPAELARVSYYERWLLALQQMMLRHGMVSPEELSGAAPPTRDAHPALTPGAVRAAMATVVPYTRPPGAPPAFQPGDPVRTVNTHPKTHTRLPLYARDKPGEIVLFHGHHVFADRNAVDPGAAAEPLYAVRFAATALWGAQANPRDSVTLDLWEPHLVPA